MFERRCGFCGEKIDGRPYEAKGEKFCSPDHADLYETRKRLGLNPRKVDRPLKLPFTQGGGGCAC